MTCVNNIQAEASRQETSPAEAGLQETSPAEDSFKPEIILASSSPRRSDLLKKAGIPFRVFTTEVDETLEPDLLANPTEAAKKLAERKAHGTVEALLNDGYVGDMVVLGADTIVVKDGRIFGKPEDAQEAKAMLEALSGATHFVVTGVSLWLVRAPEGEELSLAYRSFADETFVTFRFISPEEIEEYVATGEPLDKSGSYALQGGASKFVKAVNGEEDTVVGLPVSRLTREYPEIFAPAL